MSKRDRKDKGRDAETGLVMEPAPTIRISAHFEVVTSIVDPKLPFRLNLRLAPDPPADLAPDLKANWPKPEEWLRAPDRAQVDMLAALLNKALAAGIDLGAQHVTAHLMRSMGLIFTLELADEVQAQAVHLQTPAGGAQGIER